MRLKKRTWFVIGLGLCAGAFMFLQWLSRPSDRPTSSVQLPRPGPAQSTGAPAPASSPAGQASPPATGAAGVVVTNHPDAQFPLRLANTPKPVDELIGQEHSILLRNVLFDTANPAQVPIPDHLRAGEDPGSFIVQSKGRLTEGFRNEIRRAGARVVSYVPNNAYLVSATPAAAAALAALPDTQAVLPWHPYYKLSFELLEVALEQRDLPEGTRLNLVVFDEAREAVLAGFASSGVAVLMEQRSPFGRHFVVEPPADQLVALARHPRIHLIDRYRERSPVNDTARQRVTVAEDTMTSQNYEGLTGVDIVVGVNDTGVDETHPDLVGRVTGDSAASLLDPQGHGTHVAGTIASSGNNGPPGSSIAGSEAGANFRGMAPLASVHALPIAQGQGVLISDEYLQRNTALTNILISNNSWGYSGLFDYDISAASWDAAVRDSLPELPGMQPILPVFAAGNGGSRAGTVISPASAKNVLTVGAIEQLRGLTNLVVRDGSTNMAFLAESDSTNEVAGFSARGNVGAGVEGFFGRFKPDIVAPGAWVLSTRSSQWQEPAGSQELTITDRYEFQEIEGGEENLYTISVPPEGIRLRIRVLPNLFTIGALPPLPIHARINQAPGPGDLRGTNDVTFPVTEGTWYFTITHPGTGTIEFDFDTILTITNDPGTYYDELKTVNATAGPWYRYESGTSMAAGVVSGMLALLQEQLEQTLSLPTNSPALMKALIINGGRSLRTDLDFAVRGNINRQGWGLATLTNSVPLDLGSGPIQFFDQDPLEALATGDSRTRTISVDTNLLAQPLKITVAWTDPPGNPGVGVKLVNDLDVVVTNLDTGTVYVGNNIDSGETFTGASPTNSLAASDRINNVENIYLRPPLSTRYSVTVTGTRVNVNAVTAHPDGVVQDYVLVVSNGRNPVSVTDDTPAHTPAPRLTVLTNGFPLLSQSVGANTPVTVSTNGVTNQWTFFVFANNPSSTDSNSTLSTVGTNVAIATFIPPNLSIARHTEADIDLYVSRDPALTNLVPAAIDAAFKSRNRGGTESVLINDAVTGELFYVGVKSEDQQAAHFGLFGVSSDQPFSTRDSEGNVHMQGFPVPVDIPDGSPSDPMAAIIMAFTAESLVIQNVLVTNVISHENGGDLFGNLSHNREFAILNNHRGFQGQNVMFVWDDSDSGEVTISEPTDGPSTLRTFVGDPGAQAWQLNMIDNTPNHTGRVEQLSIRLEPRSDDLTNFAIGITEIILPNRFFFTPIDVPAAATNLTVCVKPETGPVEVYIRREDFPTRDEYDAFAVVGDAGGCIDLGLNDSPPLSEGRYIIGVFNPSALPLEVNIRARIDLDLSGGTQLTFRSTHSVEILDDARTNSVIFVPNLNTIVEMDVGVRIDHDRASDLVLTLISPFGTRLLLAENRGGLVADGYGAGVLTTNVAPPASAGGAMADTNIIASDLNFGTVRIDYDFINIPDNLRIYYDGLLIHDTGLINGAGTLEVEFGPGNDTNIVIVMNEQTGNSGTAWDYSATVFSGSYLFATFTENRARTDTPIKFAVPPFAPTNTTSSNIVTLISDFELPVAADYGMGSTIEGIWTVETNSVSIIDNPAVVLSGDQYLALTSGKLSQTLPTLKGRDYRLRFSRRAQCITGWWPLDASGIDVIGGHPGQFSSGVSFPPGVGVVGGAGDFSAANAFIYAPLSPGTDVGTNSGFTIEGWFQATDVTTPQPLVVWDNFGASGVELSIGTSTTGTGAGAIFADIVDTSGGSHIIQTADNVIGLTFHHIALTYETNTGMATLYLDGVSVASAALGTFVPQTSLDLLIGYRNTPAPADFSGLIDDLALYNCALSPAEITAIHAAGSLGKNPFGPMLPSAELFLNGIDYSLTTTPGWQRAVFPFLAATDGTEMELRGNPLSVLFDTVELVEVLGNIYYLPEEPLSEFTGRNAFGNWTLEVWDRRVGGALTNSELLSWQIQFTFLNTNPPAILLTNGLAYTATISGSNTLYFKVNVPFLASNATNSLISTVGLDLWFNQTGLPALGNQPSDQLLLDGIPEGFSVVGKFGTLELDAAGMVVDGTATPTLVPGQTYYLAVRKDDLADTNAYTFTLQVDFDMTDPNLLNVTPLTSGVLTNVTIGGTNLLDYYSFDVSSNAVSVQIDLMNLDGNVDLVVRRALPLPNPINFDYISANPGTSNEVVLVEDDSFTLLPGRWYIGVVNRDGVPVNYDIVATETKIDFDAALDGAAPQMVPASDFDYFRYNVSSNAFQVDFEIFNATGNVDLFIRRGAPLPPSNTNFFYSSTAPGLAPELIEVMDSAVINPLVPGDWWIAVQNLEGVAVNYDLVITPHTNSPTVTLTNGVPYTNTLAAMGTDYFTFPISPGAIQALFETFGADGNVDLYLAQLISQPGPGAADFSSINPGVTPELIQVTSNSFPGLAPGPWYLAVRNVSGMAVTYSVLFSELLTSDLIVLDDQSPSTNTVGGVTATVVSGLDHFTFNVPTNALQVNILLTNMNGNADLYVSDQPPLPGPAGFDFASANPGTLDEFIPVWISSVPPLVAGDWYVSVANQEATPVTYTLVVDVILRSEINRLTNGIPAGGMVGAGGGGSDGAGGGAPPAVEGGTDYYQFTVSANAVEAWFETYQADGDVDIYISHNLPLPEPHLFDYASTNTGLGDETIVVRTDSMPPLAAGDWYMAVVNRGTDPVDYQVRVVELAFPGVVELDPGLTRSGFLDDAAVSAGASVDHYRFTVDPGTVEVHFDAQITSMSGTNQLQLYVRKGGLAGPDVFDFASVLPGGAQHVEVDAGTAPALSPGEWYVAVVNPNPTNLFYRVRAAAVGPLGIQTLISRLLIDGEVAPLGDPASGGIDYYRFDLPPAALEAHVVLLNPAGDVDLYLTQGLPLPGPFWSDVSSRNPTNENELIVLATNSLPPLAAGGSWYLAVVNRETNSTTYSIGAHAIQTYPDLTDNVAFPDNLPPGNPGLIPGSAAARYRFTVSSNAIAAEFTITGANADVDLFVTRGLPTFPFLDFPLSSTNAGTANELISVNALTDPPLLPGDWYLVVLNPSPMLTGYSVKAREFFPAAVTPVTGGGTVTNSLPGKDTEPFPSIDYYSFEVSPGSVQAWFQTFGSNGDIDIFVRRGFPLPGPGFFSFASAAVGTGDELVTVTTDSAPPLAPGRWHVAVVNASTNPVNYSFRAAEVAAPPLTDGLTLTNLVPAPGLFADEGVKFHRFSVSADAVQVTFEVFGADGNVDLLVSRGLPLPDDLTADFAGNAPGTTAEKVVVTLDSVPMLAGGDWYLAVRNREAGPAGYSVRVTEVRAEHVGILANAVPATATVTTAGPGVNDGVDYYRFTVSSNAVQARFETFGANGNVDLFVSRGLPLPGEAGSDFQGVSAGLANELVEVTSNSVPVLAPGDWYLAVVNQEAFAVNYSVQVTEIGADGIVLLTNGLARAARIGSGIDYYLFPVGASAVEARFELFGLTGNVDLFLGQGLPLPGPFSFDAFSAQGLAAGELIVLTPGSTPALAPGNWYLAVVNQETNEVDYQVRVSAFGLLTAGSAVAAVAGGGSSDYYRFTAAGDELQVAFETLGASGNVDLYLRQGLPFPGQGLFDFSSVSPGALSEKIMVTLDSTPPLAPGDWYLAVVNRQAGPVSYTLDATALRAADVRELTNGVPFLDRITPAGLKYYSLNVSSNAIEALFRTFNADGDIDLFLTRGLPVPDEDNVDFSSVTFLSGNELIRVVTNSVPPLVQGKWYLLVVSFEGRDVNFSVQADEILAPTIVPLATGIATNGTVTVGGTDYYSFIVRTGAVQATFETFAASGNVDLFIRRGFPLPGGASFDFASSTPGTADERVHVTLASVPVLSPGTYHLAVVNKGGVDVDYSVRATEIGAGNLTRLTNGVPALRTSSDPVHYYVFTVGPDADDALFESLGANGNVDLYLRKGLPVPGETLFDFAGENPGTAAELLRVSGTTNPMLTAGDWYLAVLNREPGEVSYGVRASEVEVLTAGVPIMANVSGGLSDFYRITVPADPLQMTITTSGASGNVDLFVRSGLPLPGISSFDYSSSRGSTLEETVTVTVDSPVVLAAGDWYVAVAHRQASPVNYTIQVAQVLASDVRELADGVPLSETVPVGGAHYYFFTVSSNAAEVAFSSFNVDGDIDLFLTQGLPLPGPGNIDYQSTTVGVGMEEILVGGGMAPLLAPGKWYLLVQNFESDGVNYMVEANQTIPVMLASGGSTNSTVRGGGTGYYSFLVSTGAVQAVFGTSDADGDVDLYLRRALPISPFGLFDSASTNSGVANEQIVLTPGSMPVALVPGEWYAAVVNRELGSVDYSMNFLEVLVPLEIVAWSYDGTNFCLTWSSSPGANYVVQGRPDLVNPGWVAVSTNILATGTNTSHCVSFPTNRYFQVIQQ